MVYLILNTLLVIWLFYSINEGVNGIFYGILTYGISLIIALSPIGKWILSVQTGCKKITRKEHLSRLEPLFQEALSRAKQINPSIPDDVKLFMSNDKSPNAFANNNLSNFIVSILIDIVLVAMMWIWTKIGTMLVMHSGRQNEFQADEFAYNCGYGDSLAEVLDSLEEGSEKGLWANLASTHPDADDRIARLQELGSSYMKA